MVLKNLLLYSRDLRLCVIQFTSCLDLFLYTLYALTLLLVPLIDYRCHCNMLLDEGSEYILKFKTDFFLKNAGFYIQVLT